MITADTAHLFFGTLTVMGQILIGLGVLSALVFKKDKSKNFIRDFMKTYGLHFALVVAIISMGGSLIYSEVIGFDPCELCWYQRILMYPLVLLLGLAVIRKKKVIADYGILLSVVGALIAGYHYLLQIGKVSNAPCSAVGYSSACSEYFTLQFGYITIPMMALTAFALIIFSLLYIREK